MPTQKVIANLGRLSAIEVENLRVALEGSRRGERVFLDKRQLPAATRFAKPTQNLRYLDLAVLYELWREWKLDEILEELLPQKGDISASDVVAALTLQRCVDPGSKLHAERWFPTTALPEILGIDPAKFNNTRLHRVLEQLELATPALMQRLPRRYQEQRELTALFLDVTDSRFVGQGPELAEKAKTKEGVVERKVGIVLLCDNRGYPVRWKVIAGRCADATAMHDVIAQIRGLDWVNESPVICDRSMGCSAEIARLLGSGIRFVTALRSNEWDAYTNGIPASTLALLEAPADPLLLKNVIAEAGRRVEAAGMQPITPTLYVRDLGVIERDQQVESSPRVITSTSDVSRAMQLARQVHADQTITGSLNAAARRLGMTIGGAKNYRKLLRLGEDLQQEVLDGRVDGVSLARLYKVAAIRDVVEQRSAFDRLKGGAPQRPAVKRDPAIDTETSCQLRIRAVVSFNPELFVQQRTTAANQLEQIRTFVHELNESLARPRSRRTKRDVEAAIDRMLRRRDLLDAFTVRIDEPTTADESIRVHLELNIDRWQRRRMRDGFSLIVAQPDVDLSAADLCQLYRAKDAVEKDFQIIKGLIKLRPIWHHSDAKVSAHVTLCMLALLLERTLNERLRQVTAERALEHLATCCLNRFEGKSNESHYVVTQPDETQQTLLRELGLARLADDNYVVERLHPR